MLKPPENRHATGTGHVENIDGTKGAGEICGGETETISGSRRVAVNDSNGTGGGTERRREDAFRAVEIEPLEYCLHGKPCNYLDAPGGKSPVCARIQTPVFDLKFCPIRRWIFHRWYVNRWYRE